MSFPVSVSYFLRKGYYGHYDPRYRGYYDQSYWAYDDSRRGDSYSNQSMYPTRYAENTVWTSWSCYNINVHLQWVIKGSVRSVIVHACLMEKENLNSIYNISLTGRLAMRTSGSTILVTMLALMRTTVVREMLMVMTLTGAVSTVNSQSTAPTVTTADGVASAHDRNRQFFSPHMSHKYSVYAVIWLNHKWRPGQNLWVITVEILLKQKLIYKFFFHVLLLFF